jgi:hypothetical protein
VTQQMQISGNATAVPCPDGRHRVGMQITDGACTFGLLLDPDTVDQFAAGLAAAMVEAARQAKLANGGIIVPTLNGPLPAGLTRPANGHGG